MNEQQLEQIEETPMGDDDIRTYFPKAKVIAYKKLNDIEHLSELLPNNKSYLFMLVEDSPNKGHWVCMNRINDTIEFFDSYGGAPDSQLQWIPKEQSEMLGQGDKRLTHLLKNCGMKTNYNPFKYQEEDFDIQTCGRHCCLRVKTMLEGKNLDGYHKYMNELKDSSGMNYDEIVSFFIRR